MIAGTLPDFLRRQLLELHQQEVRAQQAKTALLRIYLAGAGHDLDALRLVKPIDLDSGEYAYQLTDDG